MLHCRYYHRQSLHRPRSIPESQSNPPLPACRFGKFLHTEKTSEHWTLNEALRLTSGIDFEACLGYTSDQFSFRADFSVLPENAAIQLSSAKYGLWVGRSRG